MSDLIGIIGYGFVGQAVAAGFKIPAIISDPKHNDTTIQDICEFNPLAVFVCVPTPSDGSNFSILLDVLDQIKLSQYKGLVVVKSTVLPGHIEQYDVVYNPEFLSRGSAHQDFINPPYVIAGGSRASELIDLYKKHSHVRLDRTYCTDIPTAIMVKYTANAFYAVKLAYMNEIYDVCNTVGADYNTMTAILASNPWMGSHHFQVPGPDGKRGFGGPCLPKDTKALADQFNIQLLHHVLESNERYRDGVD